MSAIPMAINETPTTCPDCGGRLSLPLGSRSRPGQVVQTCKNYQACGRAVWSAAADVVTEPIVDDGSRHGRMFLPSTSEPELPKVVAPYRWSRFSDAELATVNSGDRKLAAAGGDR